MAQRILLIRLSHLGDVVLALPVFHALRARYPEARIAWVTQPEFAGLLEGIPGLERVFLFGRDEGARAWPRLAEELAGFAPTLVVDAQGNLKSAAASLCAGSARRTGLHRRDWRESFGALVLHDRAPRVDKPVPHAMDRMLALARYVCESPAVAVRSDPALRAAELEDGRVRWRALMAGAVSGAVILQVSDPADVRSWPVAHFASLASSLARSGAPVLVVSGPGESGVGRDLEEQLRPLSGIRHWVGQHGLRELAAVFTAAAATDAALVGCDSGPMHLAAACGLRVVSLAGPQSHLRTGPWPIPEGGLRTRHAVIASPTAPTCAPCLGRRCTHPEGPVCMSSLPPELVASALVGAS